MREHIHDFANGAVPGLKMPSVSALDVINGYPGKHVAAAH
jgi:hypothetical protein